MEKFAVDLEKVLDEFEFSEEREDRVALSVISNQSLPYICHVPQLRPPINNYRRPSFEPINLADADFAASPPHILQHNLTNTANTSDNSGPVYNKDLSSSIRQYDIDDRVIPNGYDASDIAATLQPSADVSDDDENHILKQNTQSPRSSLKKCSLSNSSSSSGREDEETSSLSDEKPDLLDCNLVTKSAIVDYIKSNNTNKKCEDINCVEYLNGAGGYGVSRHLLPDVTTSTTSSLCKVSASSSQDSADDDADSDIDAGNDKRNVMFDLIDTNRNGDDNDANLATSQLIEDESNRNINISFVDSVNLSVDKDVIVSSHNNSEVCQNLSEKEEIPIIDHSLITNITVPKINSVSDNCSDEIEQELLLNKPKSEPVEILTTVFNEKPENSLYESNNFVDNLVASSDGTRILSVSGSRNDNSCNNNNDICNKTVKKDENDVHEDSVSIVPVVGFVSSSEYFGSDCIENSKEELEKYLEEIEHSEELGVNDNDIDLTTNAVEGGLEISAVDNVQVELSTKLHCTATGSQRLSDINSSDSILHNYGDIESDIISTEKYESKACIVDESLSVRSFDTENCSTNLKDSVSVDENCKDSVNNSYYDLVNSVNVESRCGNLDSIKEITTQPSEFIRSEEYRPDINTMGNTVDKIDSEDGVNSSSTNPPAESNDVSSMSGVESDDRQKQEKAVSQNGADSRVSRPNVLELPSKITVDTDDVADKEEQTSPSTSTSPSSATTITSAEGVEVCLSSGGGSSPLPCDLSSDDSQLGKVPPFWVPDSEALTCMQCQLKFTFVKRRHHCRACGQVLCSKCCSMRTKLMFMEGEARVCQPCYSVIGKANSPDDDKSPPRRQPNPNNPMEYCSTIPPLQQAAGSLHQPPPSVLVPVGVLKREGRVKSEVAKQVMFSDGIRPGGDLTELDGSGESRLPFRRPGRLTKRVGTPPGGTVNACSERIAVVSGSSRISSSNDGGKRRPLDPITQSFIPPMYTAGDTSSDFNGLPPVIERVQGEVVYSAFEPSTLNSSSDQEKPIKFAINRNLFVSVKRVMLDCCVNRECWCVTSSGLACVGQDEVILVLECMPDESAPPRDVFLLINMLYIDASKGNTVSELSFTPSFTPDLLDSRNHGGFLYIRPSYQCTSKLVLPDPPYLVALLIHKWETPWARLFPIRLVLRLGAEYRYYPCPLISVRHRQPLYSDIGHTIINILADFRKYSYTLPTVRGLVVHMEDRQTTILLPRNRYDQVVRALNNSNDSVLAFGANLSLAADSHLVCMQSSDDENSYHTQAINIHNKPRRVTGASFVVFNGALKASAGLSGKSSIVEDGLMVQVPGDTMTALRAALRDMKDYTIGCGPHAEETVILRWTADDTNFNIGVKSCIDSRPLDGVPSMRVHNGTDYSGQYRIIRWTEVFILQCEEVEGSGDPLDISRLSESLARATCMALVPYLDLLAAANLNAIAIRAIIHPDHVGYEAGSNCEKLPPLYMKSLDDELVTVVHQAAVACRDTPATLELLFRIMES